jgi:hypothetical protein
MSHQAAATSQPAPAWRSRLAEGAPKGALEAGPPQAPILLVPCSNIAYLAQVSLVAVHRRPAYDGVHSGAQSCSCCSAASVGCVAKDLRVRQRIVTQRLVNSAVFPL